MAAIISNNFRSLNAKGFIEDIRSELSNVYIGVGKSTAWQDASPSLTDFTDSGAPSPLDTIDDINQARANMVGIKLIKNNEVSHVVPRYDWVAGEIFDTWESNDKDIYDGESKKFYCLTNDFKVYKCLDRPSNVTVVSDVPTKVQAEPFTTADGYVWKYMYTIIAADSEKFLTRSYMPVKTLTVNTKSKASSTAATYSLGTAQTIELATENPNIIIGQKVKVVGTTLASGTFADTTVVTAVSGKHVTVTANVAAYGTDADTEFEFYDFEDTNPLYDQQQAQKDSIPLAGSIDRIEVTDPGTGITNTAAQIAAQIHIIGDGTTTAVVATGGVTKTANTVTRLVPTTRGAGYSLADVSIINTNLAGSGLAARAVIGPPSGHGVDPVAELGGFYVGLNVQISGVDDTDIANNQDFRQITILKNPTVNGVIQTSEEAAAEGDAQGTYRTTKFLTYDTTVTAVSNAVQTMSNLVLNGNDVLLTGSAESNGVFPRAYVTNVDLTNGKIYYVQNSLTGYQTFPPTDDVTYSNDAAPTGTVSGITLTASNGGTDFDKNSGEILFIENRDPIQRSNQQIEDIKLIIEF